MLKNNVESLYVLVSSPVVEDIMVSLLNQVEYSVRMYITQLVGLFL